jgi:hypothetical protein
MPASDFWVRLAVAQIFTVSLFESDGSGTVSHGLHRQPLSYVLPEKNDEQVA